MIPSMKSILLGALVALSALLGACVGYVGGGPDYYDRGYGGPVYYGHPYYHDSVYIGGSYGRRWR
jgi:hypothetical protein